MDDYRLIADALAADIAAGRLRPGDRLPPQRRFAREWGIAASTAARVYGELVRRGLAVGEVGRGTFVRAGKPPPEPALAEPGGARVDLELNFSIPAEQPALLARSLEGLMRPGALAAALPPVGVSGTPGVRAATAELLSRPGWTPGSEHLLFAGNGRQAIAATIAALVPVGERLGVEELTYPVVKAIATRLGVTLVPLAVDDAGLVPEALESAHRAAPLRAVYLQPALHNPLGVTMTASRRAELAETLHRLGLYAIEDAIYAFLSDEPVPFAALAPERVVLVDGLSKRIAPGLSLGFAVPPAGLADRVAAALRSGTWTAPRFALEAATCWLTDGTAATLAQIKRRDAAARQEIMRDRLGGFAVTGDPRAYHCWWELPEPWRAETFVAAASRRGIAVTPAAAFAITPGRAPSAVRLALAEPSMDTLAAALDVLASIARGTPEDTGVE
ncbi:PLP-dependent aminotransferase family protein [Actinomadura alba]|uniref:PLP-dependent aminotransferase family protein n=1 Tax=Actinomadura alba TaxID=406431 RepID=A0ABR7LLZ6_9ACTN|nr:PLP-dependent aminotransferase family protein [Actinomadura alba]MBC6465708.1 PLP-dependent aminotransferase family protein [Actinomadura alba]